MMKALPTIEQIKHNKALTAFSVVFVTIFILLGFWQIERAGFKASLIQEFELEQSKAPTGYFWLLQTMEQSIYRWIL